jgi:hypothetical protein
VIVAVTVGSIQGHMPRCRLESAKIGTVSTASMVSNFLPKPAVLANTCNGSRC